MKLLWVKSGMDILVGEIPDRSLVVESSVELTNPMILQYIDMPAPQKVLGVNNRIPQTVLGFKFNPIPCSEIWVTRVDYSGEIKKHDPVFVTYYKVLEAVKKQADDPLMVAQ